MTINLLPCATAIQQNNNIDGCPVGACSIALSNQLRASTPVVGLDLPSVTGDFNAYNSGEAGRAVSSTPLSVKCFPTEGGSQEAGVIVYDAGFYCVAQCVGYHPTQENYMSDNTQKKVIVGMSGGVDSSVSAWLLQQHGYRVEGLFMKNWEEDDNKEYCSSSSDLADAQMVCDTLGIALHTVNFAAEYWDNVFSHFLAEYQAGRTPNPDILCNKEIKFKAFLDFATDDLGADYIATGHYVRRADVAGKNRLLRGLDDNKDQSYFLYTLGSAQLARCLFPIGELAKSEVRRIATELALATADKKDSTGICFIGEKKFRDFLGRYLPAQPGAIVSIDGQKVGHHQGLVYHTLGQRKGLGIGGTRGGTKDPWYVVDKDIDHNRLIVAQGHLHPRLMSTGLIAGHLHWVEGKPLTEALCCTVKTRYRQPDIACLVTPQADERLQVTFNQPVFAVTPGQSAVFYLEECCLGGGIIEVRQPLSH